MARPLILTAAGDAKLSTAQYKFGTASGIFDGTGDKVTVAATADISGLTNFTVETWVRCGSNTAQFNNVVCQAGSSGAYTTAGYWSLRTRFNNVEQVAFTLRTGSTWVDVTSGIAVNDNNWHHIAAVKSGSIISLFVDGTLRGTGSDPQTIGLSTEPVVIGNIGGAASGEGGFIGYIDEVRISKIARYSSGFSPSTSAFTNDDNTLLLVHADGTNGSTTFTDDATKYATASLAANFSISAKRDYFEDEFYIESGYFTSDNYYTDVNAATASLASTASVTATVGVIKSTSSTMSVTFTQTVILSHIRGADMIAFASAALSAQASEIIKANINTTGVFSVATDANRFRDSRSEEYAVAGLSSIARRSRALSSESQAAFSFVADGVVVKPQGETIFATGSWTSAYSQQSQAVKTVVVSSTESSAFTLTALGSHYEGASLVAFGDSAMTVSVARLRDANSNLESTYQFSVEPSQEKSTTVSLLSSASISTLNQRLRNADSSESSAFTLTALGSHYEGASLVAFGSSTLSLSAVVIRSGSTSFTSIATLTATGGKKQIASATMSMGSFALIYGYALLERPRQYTLYKPDANNNVYIDTGTKKFGSGSMAITGTGYYQGYYSPDFNIAGNRFALELWAYRAITTNTVGTAFTIGVQAGTGNYASAQLSGYYVSNNFYLGFTWKDSTDTTRTISTQVTLANQWSHIVVSRGNGYVSLFVDGTRVAFNTAYASGTWATTFTTNKPKFKITGSSTQVTTNPAFRFDDVSFTVGWDKDYNAASSTLTVPTTEARNWPVDTYYTNSQTKTLLNFNGTFDDNITADWRGVVALPITATMSAALTGIVNAEINLAVNSSLTALGSHYEGASLVAFMGSTLTASVTKIKTTDANLSSAVTLSVDAVVTKTTSSELTSAVDIVIDNERTRNAEFSAQAFASTLFAVAKVGNGLVILDANTAMSVDAVKTVNPGSQLASEFQLDSTAIKSVVTQVDLDINSTIQTIGDLTKSTGSVQTATATLLVTPYKTVQAAMSVVSLFDITAETSGIKDGASLVFTLGSLTADVSVIRSADTAIDSSFAITVDTTNSLTKQFASSMDSAVELTADNSRTRSTSVSMSVLASELTATGKIGQGIISMQSTATMSVSGNRTARTSVAVDGRFTETASANRTRRLSSSQSAAFAVQAEGTTSKLLEADLNSNFTMSTVANKNGEIRLVAFAGSTLTTSGRAIRRAAVAVTGRITLTASAKRTRRINSQLAVTSALTTRATTLVISSATITTRFTVVANTSVLHIDEYVYIIPKESREYIIVAESRDKTIMGETREYTIRS